MYIHISQKQWVKCIGKHRAVNREVTCNFRLYLKKGRQVLIQVESSDYSQATTLIYTQEYPISLPYDWNRPNVNAQCPLFTYTNRY